MKDTIYIASFREDQDNPEIFATITIDEGKVSFDEGFKNTYDRMEEVVRDIVKKYPNSYRDHLAGQFNRSFTKVLLKEKEIKK
jgi:hypothetical protein